MGYSCFSQTKTDILKELYNAEKLSAEEINSRLSERQDSHSIHVKINELVVKRHIKRVHEKWHKPSQEYTLVPNMRRYLQKKFSQ